MSFVPIQLPEFFENLNKFWIENDYFPLKKSDTKKNVTVALSGGADSVALLIFYHYYVPNINLTAVHVNHGLRDTAQRDTRFVTNLCNVLSVPLHTVHLDASSRKNQSIEAWARDKRYEAFEKAKETFNSDVVLTAHHKDDVVETFLMRIQRGTNLNGMGSIPFRRDYFLRPFLCLPKSVIVEWLKKNGQEWVEDETNTDTSIQRNWVRNVLIPQMTISDPDIGDTIFGMTQTVKKIAPLMEAWKNEEFPLQFVVENGCIPIEWFHEGMDTTILAEILKVLNVDAKPGVLHEILKQVKNCKRNIRVALSHAECLQSKKGYLYVLPRRMQ